MLKVKELVVLVQQINKDFIVFFYLSKNVYFFHKFSKTLTGGGNMLLSTYKVKGEWKN